eukprot:jgi/Chrzof1/14106/Cz08g25100.t1
MRLTTPTRACALLSHFAGHTAPSRVNMVQDRPAGGTPDEVAQANPLLDLAIKTAAADDDDVMADVADKGDSALLERGGLVDSQQRHQHDADSSSSGTDREGGVSGYGRPAHVGGQAGGVALADGSGMDVPELAVHTWSEEA